MRKAALIVALIASLAASIGGCGTAATTANVQFAPSQADLIVRDVSVQIAPLPGYEEFTSHFASTTRDLLRAQGVRVSDVTATPSSSGSPDGDFRYHLNCRATPRERTTAVSAGNTTFVGVPGAVLNVAVRCTLRDEEMQIEVLQADVDAVKGWGPGFGREEAQPAAERLVDEMVLLGVFR